MERIEFYKMSIEEYPNHKDKYSLIFSVTELQKEFDQLESTYNDIQTESEGLRDLGIEKDLVKMYSVISLGRTYWNNPKCPVNDMLYGCDECDFKTNDYLEWRSHGHK
jgi:hypothetical protein